MLGLGITSLCNQELTYQDFAKAVDALRKANIPEPYVTYSFTPEEYEAFYKRVFGNVLGN